MIRLLQQFRQRAELRSQPGLRLLVPAPAVVNDPHPEPGRPPGHRLSDPPQPDDPQSGTVQVVTQHFPRIPFPPLPLRYLRHPLFKAAGGPDQQTKGDVGGGFGQHIRGVAHRNVPFRAGGQVNVVHSHRHLADRPQPGGRLQQFPVNPVGEHHQQTLRLPGPGQQLLPGDGPIFRPNPHRPHRGQHLLRRPESPAGNHHPRHGVCAACKASPTSPAPE